MAQTGIDRQIAWAKGELAKRRNFYPKWIAAGKVTQAKADEEIVTMTEIVETLQLTRKVCELLRQQGWRQDEPGLFS